MVRAWAVFVLAGVCMQAAAVAVAPPVEPARTEYEQSFIGEKYNSFSLAARDCHAYSGFPLPGNRAYVVNLFRCGDRYVVILGQKEDGDALALDARLLPPIEDANDLNISGECEDKKKPLRRNLDRLLLVIARYPENRYAVDWKTGVKAAWWPNTKTKRIEDYPIRNIVCRNEPTPP